MSKIRAYFPAINYGSFFKFLFVRLFSRTFLRRILLRTFNSVSFSNTEKKKLFFTRSVDMNNFPITATLPEVRVVNSPRSVTVDCLAALLALLLTGQAAA